MKHLIIGVIILVVLFQLAIFIWPSKEQPPSTTFTRLLEPPQCRLATPYENGYFYLLGFAAAASLDPAKVGHEMWLEVTAVSGASNFNYDKPERSELQSLLPMEQILPSWNSENPASEFRKTQTQFQALAARDRIFMTRYERWLTMPFEDMGFGHQGTPRVVEIFTAHRLYVADGFSRQTALGMQRLKIDLQMWRKVLRDATTITTKVMAQIVITDDLRLLSTLLSRPIVDKTLLSRLPDMVSPLTTAELSLRWPLQHQLTVGVHNGRTGGHTAEEQAQSLDTHTQWMADAARLPHRAFRRIVHPHGRAFLGLRPQTQETWDMYALYYDAMIHAAESGQKSLPTLREIADIAQQGMVERFVDPNPFEPDWGPFYFQLKETDARLRLASLQVVLQRPSSQTTVPNRLAQVGSSYYDPFSGLPMLWSPTQQKIYSVGKDRYDDGGDASFDISVPAVVSRTPLPKESRAGAPSRRTNRL